MILNALLFFSISVSGQEPPAPQNQAWEYAYQALDAVMDFAQANFAEKGSILVGVACITGDMSLVSGTKLGTCKDTLGNTLAIEGDLQSKPIQTIHAGIGGGLVLGFFSLPESAIEPGGNFNGKFGGLTFPVGAEILLVSDPENPKRKLYLLGFKGGYAVNAGTISLQVSNITKQR